MSYVHIKEPVEVIVQFSPQGLIHPLAFSWAGRQYRVKKTTYRWRTGKGRETLRFFSVVTRAENAYQLCFKDEDATWWLEKVWSSN